VTEYARAWIIGSASCFFDATNFALAQIINWMAQV
jgi:hypothetical protein